ncbi:MAG: TerD family protein [Firmicutes bacterium]|nr:TerD family protein [Bacillota bacterium]
MITIPMKEAKSISIGAPPSNVVPHSTILQKGQRQILNTNELQLCFASDNLDISLFLIDESGKVINDDWFLYYSQKSSPDHSVYYYKDNIINTNLKTLNSRVQKIIITLTSDDKAIPNTALTVTDLSHSKELFSMSIESNQSQSMIACEIYRKNKEWRFFAANQCSTETLYDFCMRFGVQVND